MTFSCIKFKRKFKMKFSMTNYSVEGSSHDDNIECDNVVKDNSQTSSQSYALSKSLTTTGSSESSCILDSSTSGLCQTSSSQNETTNESFNATDKSLDRILTEAEASKASMSKKTSVSNSKNQKKMAKAKKSDTRISSPSNNFKSSSLPPPPLPPPPPYVPSLESMPSLPNSSISNSFAAIDSTTTNSACFNTNLISSSHNVLHVPVVTKSSVSNSSSSGKISDSSSKQHSLVSRLISNRIDKFKLIGKNRHQSPNSQPAPEINVIPQSPLIQHHQFKLYDKINLKSKLKEHLYSPLHFESEPKVFNSKNLGHNINNSSPALLKKQLKNNNSNNLKEDSRTRKDHQSLKERSNLEKRDSYSPYKNGTDMVRGKLYFKSNLTSVSTNYDECNYAKSINTNDSADETENPKTNEDDYHDRDCFSKNCTCQTTEDEYYQYDDNNPYEEHDYNDCYIDNFENEYDDVDYEKNEKHSLNDSKKSSPRLENTIKRKTSLKYINQIIVNSLEEVLTATKDFSEQNEQDEDEPVEKSQLSILNEMINKELLCNDEEVTSLSITRINVSAQSSNQETISECIEPIKPAEKKTSNEIDGYIRLTEDEINDIINTTVPIKIDEPDEPVKANTSLENSITCTSF